MKTFQKMKMVKLGAKRLTTLMLQSLQVTIVAIGRDA